MCRLIFLLLILISTAACSNYYEYPEGFEEKLKTYPDQELCLAYEKRPSVGSTVAMGAISFGIGSLVEADQRMFYRAHIKELERRGITKQDCQNYTAKVTPENE